MDRELESRIFFEKNYINRDKMVKEIQDYIEILKIKYKDATIIKEFYKGNNIVVSATNVAKIKNIKPKIENKEPERKMEFERERER